MKWTRRGPMGMISEPYRVGKFALGDHLAYRLWYLGTLIAEKASWEEIERAADEHQAANADLKDGHGT